MKYELCYTDFLLISIHPMIKKLYEVDTGVVRELQLLHDLLFQKLVRIHTHESDIHWGHVLFVHRPTLLPANRHAICTIRSVILYLLSIYK